MNIQSLVRVYIDFGEFAFAVYERPDEFHPYYTDRFIQSVRRLLPDRLRTLEVLEKAMSVAVSKHPVFADTVWEGLSFIAEELGELSQALNKKQPEDRVHAELLDLYIVALRFQERFS